VQIDFDIAYQYKSKVFLAGGRELLRTRPCRSHHQLGYNDNTIQLSQSKLIMKAWLDPQPITIPDNLYASVGGHRMIAESLVRRGIHSPQAARRFLNPAAYTPAAPDALPDMGKALSRLQKALRNGEQILVWGDFDVDGQTSTTLLVAALRGLGAQVVYHVPNRFTEGHGIHLPNFKKWLDDGIELVLTCDTGIAAHDAVDYARQRGIDVIITDHHALPDALPSAYAVINPMRLRERHPLRELPGVGTAYQLVRALYGTQSSEHLLDLVAIGIVADVMVQVDDTRYWLQRGLEVLRQAARPGLQAMMRRAEIDPAYLTEMDIGFSLAPRLNALGRLADANPAVELLSTDDKALIAERVNELEGLNQKRKFLTRQVYEAAKQQIENEPSLLKYAALVIAGAAWHSGVIGIVASRLVEDYGCPVIVLSENNGHLSGSARSIKGINIVEAIRSQADLLNAYGGHNMAAGLSLHVEQLFEFRRGLSQVVRDMLGKKEEVQPEITIDAYVDLAEINLEFAEDIARLAPFGNGNPPLTLATTNVEVKSRRTMGSRGDHLDLRVVDETGHEQRVLWWFGDLDSVPVGHFDMAYTVRPNVFNGKYEALIEWLDARPSQTATITITQKSLYAVIDYRQHPSPEAMCQQILREYDDVLIWAEARATVDGLDRYHLHPAQTLVVWTVPPDTSVWRAAISTVQPQSAILFSNMPTFRTPQELITHIIGLAKYAIQHKQGQIILSELASLTGQREQTIHLCLKWISANTNMRFHFVSDELYTIEMPAEQTRARDEQLEKRLQLLFAETQAYRNYWLRKSFV